MVQVIQIRLLGKLNTRSVGLLPSNPAMIPLQVHLNVPFVFNRQNPIKATMAPSSLKVVCFNVHDIEVCLRCHYQ